MIRTLIALPVLLVAVGCSSFIPRDLPKEAPPLADMEEPLLYFDEPNDEAEREALSPGGFTGIEVKSARRRLGEPEENPEGLLVVRVVENSPADAAGIREDDIILTVYDADDEEHLLSWPSEWRKLELAAEPGTTLTVVYDRAGVEEEAKLQVVPRVRPAKRVETERFREEEKVGVVVRTATEVEARDAGLGPGGGAVIVGLSRASPFRRAGLQYGDLIVAVDGTPLSHPQVLLDALREPKGDTISVTYVRDGVRETTESALTQRVTETRRVNIPLIYEFERDRGSTYLFVLFGIIRHRTTPAAWDLRILWIINFDGGEADRLEEVKTGGTEE